MPTPAASLGSRLGNSHTSHALNTAPSLTSNDARQALSKVGTAKDTSAIFRTAPNATSPISFSPATRTLPSAARNAHSRLALDMGLSP